MQLTKEQEQEILAAYLEAKQNNTLVDTSKEEIKALAKAKRVAFLHNKKIIDEVFYSEMANA